MNTHRMILVTCLLGAVMLLTPLCAMVEAEEVDYTKLPGYVDLSFLSKLDKTDKSVEIYISKPLLSLVAAMNTESDPSLSQLIGGLALIRVEEFEVPEKDRTNISGFIKDISATLAKNKWEKMVHVVDENERVEIFLKTDGSKITGLLVMAMDQEFTASFINIVGDLDLALLGKLGKQFNIPNLDKVPGSSGDDEHVEDDNE